MISINIKKGNTMPFYDPSSWEISQEIFKHKETLIVEFNKCVEDEIVKEKPNDRTTFNDDLYKGYVGFLPISMDPTIWSPNERKMYSPTAQSMFDKNKLKCPIANSIIEKFPAVRQWYWNTLAPGGQVTPHYGTNGVNWNKVPDHTRVQYCWEPGNNCKFFLEKEYIEYTENLCFGFEDGMDLHWVKNEGDKFRTVLILDLWLDKVPPIVWGHPNSV